MMGWGKVEQRDECSLGENTGERNELFIYSRIPCSALPLLRLTVPVTNFRNVLFPLPTEGRPGGRPRGRVACF